MQPSPLPGESELLLTDGAQVLSLLTAQPLHRRGLPVAKLRGPGPPRGAVIEPAQDFKGRVVLEPVAAAVNEGLALA